MKGSELLFATVVEHLDLRRPARLAQPALSGRPGHGFTSTWPPRKPSAIKRGLGHCLPEGGAAREAGPGSGPASSTTTTKSSIWPLRAFHHPQQLPEAGEDDQPRDPGPGRGPGRGVLLITGHYGALEFMPGALAFRDYPLSVMVHCKTPRLKAILEERSAAGGHRAHGPQVRRGVFHRRGSPEAGPGAGHPVRRDKHVEALQGQDHPASWASPCPWTAPWTCWPASPRPRWSWPWCTAGAAAATSWSSCARQEHPAAAGQTQVSVQCLSVLSEYILKQPNQWYEWKKLDQFLPVPKWKR